MKPTTDAASTNRFNLPRRQFLAAGAAACLVGGLGRQAAAATGAATKAVPLGLDGHSLRGMKWKAHQFLDFAIEQNLDAVLINNLPLFESLEPSYLKPIKQKADQHGMKIYMGAGSICEIGSAFNPRFGDAKTFLGKAIDVARIVGSPVVTVRIGKLDDRYLEGGIGPRIDAAVGVLKAMRNRAVDASIKFGFENHGGDLRSEEVLEIIDRVGPDVCGSMLDPGNSVWVLEDPMKQLELLGPHVVCTSVRDYMVWPSEEGATCQWTAVGEGLMDVPEYLRLMATLCPDVPLFVESISNSVHPIPYLQEEWWEGFPNLLAADIVDFLALCRRGKPLDVALPPQGMDRKEFEQENQKEEFLKSIAYLRKCGAGRKGEG